MRKKYRKPTRKQDRDAMEALNEILGKTTLQNRLRPTQPAKTRADFVTQHRGANVGGGGNAGHY